MSEDNVGHLKAENAQLKFLLASAPMIDAPTEPGRWKGMTSPFAYIHPKTFAKIVPAGVTVTRSFVVISPSPTKWVLLSTMPEGRVIFSPLPIPGLEKILAS